MNLKLASFVIALLTCLQFTTQQEIARRAPGDLIWTQCGNISRTILTQNIQIDNVCVTLTEANNCGVMVRVTVANQQILNERFDTNVGATVCGTTGIAPGVSCSVCSSFRDSPPSQQCVFLQPNCTVANVPTGFWPPTRLGCFPNEKLAFMQQCQQNDCPGSCSGHGTCYGGECNCNDGWFGNDCSINTQLFEKCQRIDQFAGTVCVRLIFKQSCEIALQTVVESGPLELYKQEQSYSIKNFNSVFQQQKCYDTPGCQLCLKWDELELTKTNAHGCGTLSVVCGGLTVGSYSLGCFDDDQVVPACFGSCINDCSGHGSCDQGICTCDSGHEGDDCSIEIKCPNNCGGKEQGTCTKGVCSCKSGYSGDDCSKKDVQSSSFKPAYVIVPIILVAGVGVFGFTIYFVKKRNSSEQPRFHRFDLMEEETKDSAELQGSVE